jgi:ABC-type branched-subunit amino acid transport system ATPase component
MSTGTSARSDTGPILVTRNLNKSNGAFVTLGGVDLQLLLLDEPNEGLAPKIIDAIIAAVFKLKLERVPMLVSEQSLQTIRACGDRVAVIERSSSVFHGTAAEFRGNPDIARQYLMVGH